MFIGIEHPLANCGTGSRDRIPLEPVSARALSIGMEQTFLRDVSHIVISGCSLDVFFDTEGPEAVQLLSVELLRDGVGLDKDTHPGEVSSDTHRGNIYRIQPGVVDPSALYTIKLKVRTRREAFLQGMTMGINRRCHASGRKYCAYWWDQRLTSYAKPFQQSTVFGVAKQGQLRRGVLNYVARERAQPARTMLHYNTWYSAGTGQGYDEDKVLKILRDFQRELVVARGVKMDSVLLDDGWDNTSSLWHFHDGFPNGLDGVTAQCADMGMQPGIWCESVHCRLLTRVHRLSPWGGYHKPKQQRVTAAREEGFEIIGLGDSATFRFHGSR